MFKAIDSIYGQPVVGVFGAAVSFGLFYLNTKYLLPLVAPSSARETIQKCWKWRNTVNSFIHSSITGVGAIAK